MTLWRFQENTLLKNGFRIPRWCMGRIFREALPAVPADLRAAPVAPAARLAGTMSGGQQQMLAIARGIMAAPKLLCLDEPSLGLAPAVIEDIGVKIREINKTKGTSILLVEQNVHLAFGTAEYCYTLQVGELVAEGTVADIRQNDVVKKAYFGG